MNGIDLQNKILGVALLDLKHIDTIFQRFSIDDFTDIRKKILKKLVGLKEKNCKFEVELFEEVEQNYIMSCLEKEFTSSNLKMYLDSYFDTSRKEKIKSTIKSLDFNVEKFEEIKSKINKTLDENSVCFEINKTTIQDAFHSFYRETELGIEQTINLGYDTLNKLCTFDAGDVILVGANTGMGKTAFGIDLMLRSTTIGKHKGLFVSLEMPTSQLLARMISNISQIEIGKLKKRNRKYLTDVEWSRIGSVQEKLMNKIEILDTSNTNVDYISEQIKEMNKVSNYDFVVIDYLQLMKDVGKSRYEIITNVSLKIKKLARELNKPIICLAQLNRENVKRADKKPLLTDLKDSSQLEQDCSIGILLHSDEYHDKDDKSKKIIDLTAYIDKNRNGALGKMNLRFKKEFQSFEEME